MTKLVVIVGTILVADPTFVPFASPLYAPSNGTAYGDVTYSPGCYSHDNKGVPSSAVVARLCGRYMAKAGNSVIIGGLPTDRPISPQAQLQCVGGLLGELIPKSGFQMPESGERVSEPVNTPRSLDGDEKIIETNMEATECFDITCHHRIAHSARS